MKIIFFRLNDKRSRVHGDCVNLGKIDEEGNEADVEEGSRQVALGEATTVAPILTYSDKEDREEKAGMIDEGQLFYSNDVHDGSHEKTAKVDHLFKPNTSACVRKNITIDPTRDMKNSLFPLQNRLDLLSSCCSLG